MQINVIAACARNRVIGINGTLPWSIPRDWQYFLDKTDGRTCIMGRISAEEYPTNANRPVILISKSWHAKGKSAPHTEVATSYSHALDLAAARNLPEVWICGGATIYEASLASAHKLFLTRVELDVAGDTFFPPWQHYFDVLESRDEHDDNGTRFAFEVWTKSKPSVISPSGPTISSAETVEPPFVLSSAHET
ncbi:hypothetical protein H310_06016 [Aphanomyces invadans]|uniref:Bifunctional dihydrofolate reductase-thymidylate synthase n=1 Tax=Aphanomyces invadans TaxID=157072 RepID=A0A024U8I5_9STRA|nr:hypothetical protein H310_06016 [Aphanomyces invadans]ETW02520.1 hypothetical protein H310_06016 [Aphanomyces invadans]|eukprot:XP_008869125.1 hypothetical protein H310_06016 [Aphanomyces invadans]